MKGFGGTNVDVPFLGTFFLVVFLGEKVGLEVDLAAILVNNECSMEGGNLSRVTNIQVT